jgi:hypothetical protein
MKKIVALVAISLSPVGLHATTEWSAQDFDLYPGDFNGDGKTDILFIAKDPSKRSGIAAFDGNGPNLAWQMWSSSHLGIQWHGGLYSAIVADFNNDNKSDVLLQRATAGDSHLLLADAEGRLTGIAQTIGTSHLGLTWPKDQRSLIPGDFSGASGDDLFLQAASSAGTHGVPLSNSSGQFTTAPAQTFTDASWTAFKWSRSHSVITAGDFNGDGRADLLIQARPKIVLIDYEIPVPVPTYAPNTFGIVYSQGGSSPLQQVGVQQWSRDSQGVDWSPTSTVAIVGDFNNDGRDDVLLQARNSGRQSYLLTGNASGAAFSAPIAVSSNVTLTADGARLLAGRFGTGGSVGLYVQATTPSGTNYVANSVSSSFTAAAHDPALVTTGETVRYSYDAKGRLVRVMRMGNINGGVETQYQYDKANNRTTIVTSGSPNSPP